MARRQWPWPTFLLLGAVAAAIYGATSFGWRQPALPPAAGTRADTGKPNVCVTRYVLCATRPGRAGDPCSCPHLLRGMVPGHIERVGELPALPGSDDWNDSAPADSHDDLDSLRGP